MARQKTWATGDTLTAANLNTEFDELYQQNCDRTAGRWGSNDDIQVTFGSSQNGYIEWDTATTSLKFGLLGATAHTFFDSGGEIGRFAAKGLFIGDTSDANLTKGIVLNQGATDDFIATMKSSDVAHGITDVAETDTYGGFGKFAALTGGLHIHGLSDNAAATSVGLGLSGYQLVADATKSTGGVGAVIITGLLKSGTGTTTLGAGTNILAVRNSTATQFIVDADGQCYQNAGTSWSTFDDFDDLELLTTLAVQVSREDDPIRRRFREFLNANREPLEKAKLVTFNDDGGHFVNMSKLTMLLVGAVRQIGGRLTEMGKSLAAIEMKMLGEKS